jgi:hypothetical protein
MAKVLDKAREESEKMGDEYMSVEHLFLLKIISKIIKFAKDGRYL